MNVKKEAAKDAFEFARAQMFFGEGAGTRRKLIKARIDHRIDTVPGYAQAYMEAFQNQDMEAHADAAAKERRRKDISKKVDRNVRGLASGRNENLTAGLTIAVGAYYVAKQTGYDEKIKTEVKKRYIRAKNWVEIQKAKRKLRGDFNIKVNEDGTYRFKKD